ncbi:MAG: 30S ribosomal protein S12 methylthiotransferase RimO [Clostridiales bacterium]|nr:30S ribosomal protein S12 methylthiotransferase RimO [Candidatus Apopatousia equi]
MTKSELLKKKVAVISLGCDKNTVDAEKMMYLLSSYGFEFVSEIEKANIAIVNTCAFILSSKTESIDKLMEVASYKNQNLEKLICTGCLPQRYYDEINSIPEVDAVVRIKNNEKIVDIICALYGVEKDDKIKQKAPNRLLSTPSHYAFLKIADGCNNFCSYCTIPFIRGRFKSTPIEEIIDEAKALVKNGVKELILVAQDVTNYGTDLYGSPKLVELIKELSKIKNLEWIRLHYCYPYLITDELLNEIDNNDKVCKYLDIPLQHIQTHILKDMNRKETREDIERLIEKIRSLKHEVSIRSTFIVGFPGETHKDIESLCEFLEKYKLDNVGFFTYSREQNTKAYKLPHQILEFVKKHRLKKVQEVQEKIMLEKQNNKIGKTYKVICDEVLDNVYCNSSENTYILRSEYSSVDVDTVCIVKTSEKLNVGEFYNIKITNLDGIDLVGKVI